ncbi:hypothetical protein BGX28_003171 [Mortierella sp. GBA30]|nr:hypothetical protein BGX28_003171 [Mortierella sp. GBA30]
MDQLLNCSRVQGSNCKKLYELLCLVIKPTRLLAKEDLDPRAELQLVVKIITSVFPIASESLEVLQRIDPHLDLFSAIGTTFIRSSNSVYKDISEVLQCLVNDPEAIRQLGRVFLTAGMSVLDILVATHRLYSEKGDEMDEESRRRDKDRHLNPTINHLSKPADLMSGCLVMEMTGKVLDFVKVWVGPQSLELTLKVYGEDDAGLSWLLKTMSSIQQRLEELSRLAPSYDNAPTMVELQDHLLSYAHPLEALFLFLETIGFDEQTLIDMLLTIDDHDTGGMLGAIMTILRNFTEQQPSDQQWRRLFQRWRREIEEEMVKDDNNDDDEDGALKVEKTKVRQLFNIEHCLRELASRIQLLDRRGLFPYSPRVLLVVLDRTQDILSSLISELTASV